MQLDCLWGRKTAYELIISIRFCTTPKEGLSHYSYIFRKMDPLGGDIKNVDCYRSATMLYLEIQNCKDDTKTLEFQKYLGGPAV